MKHVLAILALALSFSALAQPFKQQPRMEFNDFMCDDVGFLFVDRDARCRISLRYLPDPSVGLTSVKVQFIEDYHDSNGTRGKNILEAKTFSKENGLLTSYPFWERPFTHVIVLEFQYRIEYTVDWYNPGILGLFSGSGTYKKDMRVEQVRAKLTFRFANGIEFPKETFIPVKY